MFEFRKSNNTIQGNKQLPRKSHKLQMALMILFSDIFGLKFLHKLTSAPNHLQFTIKNVIYIQQ